MIKDRPRIKIADIFAGLFIFLGFLFFLIMLHILTINATGDTQDVLNTTFIISLRIFEILLLFSMVGLIIHLLRYGVWLVTTPKWLKKKFEGGRGW